MKQRKERKTAVMLHDNVSEGSFQLVQINAPRCENKFFNLLQGSSTKCVASARNTC